MLQIFFCVLICFIGSTALALETGIHAVDITPRHFEGWEVNSDNPHFGLKARFWDTGHDLLFDFEEAGAFGPDHAPGIANWDDDGDGIVDNCSRKNCAEYLAVASDDLPDPAGDNVNSSGREGDGRFDYIPLAGFRPFITPLTGARLASHIHDPIWTRALYLKGDNHRELLLISLDVPGMTWKHIERVKRQIHHETGITPEQIVIASTHNHSAPDVAGYWVTFMKGHNRPYVETVQAAILTAAKEARKKSQPAAMKTITTTHLACQDPRSGELKKSPYCREAQFRYQYNEEKTPGEKYDRWIIQADLRDPILRNTEIVAVQFLNPQNQETIATLAIWANHPNTLKESNTQISSDYPHYLRKFLETHLGGQAIYFTSTVGCHIGPSSAPAPLWNDEMQPVYENPQDPHSKRVLTSEVWEKIRSIGYEIGFEIVQALQNNNTLASSVSIDSKADTVLTPVDNFLHLVSTRSVWMSQVQEEDAMVLKWPNCLLPYGCSPSMINQIQLGDLSLITSPGETDPAYFFGRNASEADYGKKKGGKIKYEAMPAWRDHLSGPHKAVIGQAQNYLSYLIHEKDNLGWYRFDHPNHYEEFVTTSRYFGDDVGNKMMQLLGSSERYSSRKILDLSPNDRRLQRSSIDLRTKDLKQMTKNWILWAAAFEDRRQIKASE